MKPMTNNQSIRIILLARPGDSLCGRIMPFFLHRDERFIRCSNPYEIAVELNTDPVPALTILICRPYMILKQVTEYFRARQLDLCIIGWLDPQEHHADIGFNAAGDYLSMTVSRCEQLSNILNIFERIIKNRINNQDKNNMPKPPLSQSVRDLLSDDELNALLDIA